MYANEPSSRGANPPPTRPLPGQPNPIPTSRRHVQGSVPHRAPRPWPSPPPIPWARHVSLGTASATAAAKAGGRVSLTTITAGPGVSTGGVPGASAVGQWLNTGAKRRQGHSRGGDAGAGRVARLPQGHVHGPIVPAVHGEPRVPSSGSISTPDSAAQADQVVKGILRDDGVFRAFDVRIARSGRRWTPGPPGCHPLEARGSEPRPGRAPGPPGRAGRPGGRQRQPRRRRSRAPNSASGLIRVEITQSAMAERLGHGRGEGSGRGCRAARRGRRLR